MYRMKKSAPNRLKKYLISKSKKIVIKKQHPSIVRKPPPISISTTTTITAKTRHNIEYSGTIYFYTFCVDMKRHSQENLLSALKILLKSIHINIKDYKLICYTNFINDYNLLNGYNIEYRKYYYNSKFKLYNNNFLNLSFNKINIYKDLHDEYKTDFIWIDLDTIITADISYINNMSNVFIENGGACQKKNILFTNNDSITVPRHKYIQGNFWKLNIQLFQRLIETLTEIQNKKLILRYDLQDLFTYYIYIKQGGDLTNINILGNNVKEETLNGLSVWSKIGNTHATADGLNNLYYEHNKLRSKYYNDKEIHILSFTFNSLKPLYKSCVFKQLFDEGHHQKKIAVFGTCRIDDYNIENFIQHRKKYPYTYSNPDCKLFIRPLGYTTTSSDVLQNLKIIKDKKEHLITDPFIFRNVFLKHGGEVLLNETSYDYIVIEVCSIKKIIHTKSNYIFPYEIEGNYNKTDYKIETEDFHETVNNIIAIRDLINCKIILLPPIVEFNGDAILGVHENIVPEKVLEYRKDIISRLQFAAREKNIFFYNWNDSIIQQGVGVMVKDQFHFTDYGKKYISKRIYDIIRSNEVFYHIEDVSIKIPYDNHKRHRYYQMFKERSQCEVLFRMLIKFLYQNNILDKTKNIVDLGAWIGDNAIPWSMMIEGTVHAIDPSVENIQYINELKFLNKISNLKTIKHCISDVEEYVYTNDDVKHARFNTKDGKTQIKTTTLDALYSSNEITDVNFVHLDVEGMEHKVLQGTMNIINQCDPIIVWENHLETDDYIKTVDFFKNLNYNTYLINEMFPHCRRDCRNFISIPYSKDIDANNINIIFGDHKFDPYKADVNKPFLIQLNPPINT